MTKAEEEEVCYKRQRPHPSMSQIQFLTPFDSLQTRVMRHIIHEIKKVVNEYLASLNLIFGY